MRQNVGIPEVLNIEGIEKRIRICASFQQHETSVWTLTDVALCDKLISFRWSGTGQSYAAAALCWSDLRATRKAITRELNGYH